MNAARDYKRAGDHIEFDYEHKILLYRKAIHFAYAEQWNEAVELLEKEPALKTALTKRFQLYRMYLKWLRQTKTLTMQLR